MTTAAVHRLAEGARAMLAAHFLALPTRDRSLRFGTPLGPTAISAYVDRIDFCRDAILGVYCDRLELGGVAHVAFGDDLAELGLSVLPAYRRRGMGSALFRRALAHACRRCVSGLAMYFLSENAPIMRIAQRFGMDVAARDDSAYAHLQLRRRETNETGLVFP